MLTQWNTEVPNIMYLTYDHAVSNGQGGYGAVRVEYNDEVHYIGRGFALTVLVERFPDGGLTYEQAERAVAWLSVMPTGARSLHVFVDDRDRVHVWAIGSDCVAAPSGLYCECEPGDIGCNYEVASWQASRDFG